MKPTLLIMAAGIGSRYGGIKQLDVIGPSGETMIDYSVYDAIQAGFEKVVFIVRKELEDECRSTFDGRFGSVIETDYVCQELDSHLPAQFTQSSQSTQFTRTKPWGTGHAVLTAKDAIHAPFLVINADDFYGRESFTISAEYLQTLGNSSDVEQYSMVGFTLRNTLSPHGTVSRGICAVSEDGHLTHVVERTKVAKAGDAAKYIDDDGNEYPLTGEETVSMNVWGFTPSIFAHIQAEFEIFLGHHGQDPTREFYIPSVVSALIDRGNAKVKVLPSNAKWFGITYQEDRVYAQQQIESLIKSGQYPESLW